VTEGLLHHYKDLVKVVAAASLDPKRACEATIDIRNALFCKLNSYVELLNDMGVLSWRTYNENFYDLNYSMDELGNDMTKH